MRLLANVMCYAYNIIIMFHCNSVGIMSITRNISRSGHCTQLNYSQLNYNFSRDKLAAKLRLIHVTRVTGFQ